MMTETQQVEETTATTTYCEYDESTQALPSVGAVLDLFGLAREYDGTTSLSRAGWSAGVGTKRIIIAPVTITFPANDTTMEMHEGMIVQFEPEASKKLSVHSLEGFGSETDGFKRSCIRNQQSEENIGSRSGSGQRMGGGNGSRKTP